MSAMVDPSRISVVPTGVDLKMFAYDEEARPAAPVVVFTGKELSPEDILTNADFVQDGKVIRWCQVDVGPHNPESGVRGIVCGARNFDNGQTDEGRAVVVYAEGTITLDPEGHVCIKTNGHKPH